MRVYENKDGFMWGDFQVERQEGNILLVKNTRNNSEIELVCTDNGIEVERKGE